MDDVTFHNLPQVLVLGPGGTRGFYQLGYLHVLDKNNILKEVDTYIGVSVGAIIALLLACGYTPSEIVNIAIISDMLSLGCLSNLSDTWNNRGLLSTENIEKTLKKYVTEKLLHIPTYYGLFSITGKTLANVTVTDTRVKYFDPISTPNVSCIEGVMASLTIPFIFHERIFEGQSYIDGVFGNCYPVDQYDDTQTSILGISIHNDYCDDTTDNNIIYQFVTKFTHFMKIFDTFTECHYQRVVNNSSDKVINIKIYDDSYDTIGLTKTNSDKAHMLYIGTCLAEMDLRVIKWISNGQVDTVIKMPTPRERIEQKPKVTKLRDSI